ncbi:protein JINGUBANG-like [Selaginella moellendorffii]|uniref:protein JINGUBANG-like n=1 Tax=Selaginella moellendorffii TaxID=88036 RepID=UPI000D1CF967|nr:protein JINGUBANG-like [Selaginella moellendorffii]|eukprot:XP_024516122.1 protein JINGUBANG-like [Selaginella moellendorffii]
MLASSSSQHGPSSIPVTILSSQPSLVSQPSSSLASQSSSELTTITSVNSLPPRPAEPLAIASPSLERKDSFNSQLSSPSSSNISAFISFASSCQFPGIQGATSKCLKVLRAHRGHITALAVSSSRRILYTASGASSSIHAWSIPDLDELCVFDGGGAVKFLLVVVDPPGLILSSHHDHKIRAWKMATTTTSSSSSKDDHDRRPRKSTVTKFRAKHVATVPTVWNRLVTFIPARNYVKIRRHRKSLWIQHSDVISCLATSPDGSLIFSASWDKTFKVWRSSDFKCLESVEAHEDAINSLVSSSSGFLYTCSADAKIKAWERTSRCRHALLATLEGHKSGVNAMVLSPDEQLLYSGSSDRKILVWEREESANHMSLLGALRGHRQAVLCLAAMGDFLCSGSADRSVRVWRKSPGGSLHACIALLEGHFGPVKALAVAPLLKSSSPGRADVENDHGAASSIHEFVVYSGSLDSDVRVWLITPDENFPSAQMTNPPRFKSI